MSATWHTLPFSGAYREIPDNVQYHSYRNVGNNAVPPHQGTST
jgi:hypothetical protein